MVVVPLENDFRYTDVYVHGFIYESRPQRLQLEWSDGLNKVKAYIHDSLAGRRWLTDSHWLDPRGPEQQRTPIRGAQAGRVLQVAPRQPKQATAVGPERPLYPALNPSSSPGPSQPLSFGGPHPGDLSLERKPRLLAVRSTHPFSSLARLHYSSWIAPIRQPPDSLSFLATDPSPGRIKKRKGPRLVTALLLFLETPQTGFSACQSNNMATMDGSVV